MKKIIISLEAKYTNADYDYLLNEIKKVVVLFNSHSVNTATIKED